MQLVCPDCGTRNRVPSERLQDDPVCGRCRAALRPGRPVETDDRRFAALIGHELPTLVDFHASWCGPCRMMAPQFERAAALLPSVRFATLDIDAQPRTTAAQRVRSVPTLVLYHQGRELARLNGATRAVDLVRWVQQQLEQAGVAATA